MNTRRRHVIAAGALLPSTLAINSVLAQSLEEPTEADIGYCQDMTVHHVQALTMCQRVLGRDPGDSVQAAAAEVLQNQAMEVGQMRAWLTDWAASTVPPVVVMGWMGANQGDGMPIGMMPGYATNEELAELTRLSGQVLGRRWLQLMRAHHVGGVMMAEEATNLASSPKVVRLAILQISAQTYEISQYDRLLEGEYATA